MLRSFFNAASALALNYHSCNFTDYSRYKGLWIGHTSVDRFLPRLAQKQLAGAFGPAAYQLGCEPGFKPPNDFFNTYSFFDFDYTKRPGADALRLQHFLEDMWRVQAAVSPARNSRHMVAAAMLNLNHWNYDFQALAGYYHNPLAPDPDDIMFSEFAITLSAQHPFSPVFGGGLSLMALPDIEAAFVMPSLSYYVLPNPDPEFVSQIFIGGKNSIFEETGSSWFLGLHYSF